jgi:hypothetical protein
MVSRPHCGPSFIAIDHRKRPCHSRNRARAPEIKRDRPCLSMYPTWGKATSDRLMLRHSSHIYKVGTRLPEFLYVFLGLQFKLFSSAYCAPHSWIYLTFWRFFLSNSNAGATWKTAASKSWPWGYRLRLLLGLRCLYGFMLEQLCSGLLVRTIG